jgi:hypothetical protein
MSHNEDLIKTLRSANKYLQNHTFEVYYLFDSEGEPIAPTNVKIKLTGVKTFISMGDSKPFVTYTAYILPSNEKSDKFNSILSAHFGREVEIKTFDHKAYGNFSWVMTKKLSELLKYFSLPEAILTKVINEVEPMKSNVNEGLIVEAKYDNVVRTLIKDIISFYKHQREGEFSLPEDIRGEEHMTYTFPEIKNEFSIELNLALDEDVETVDVDAAYYREEDVIEVTIVSNPDLGYQNLQELIGELNETIRHELEHVSQHEKGYKFPKEPKGPLKYYTQKHELEAQLAGFKRRARKENRDLEELMRGWFRRNQSKHGLKPKEVDIVINKLLELDGKLR